MKKTLLLTTAAACLTAFNANAYTHSMMGQMRPYVGAEYVFSHAKNGGEATNAKDNFHSGKADIGMEWANFLDTEFSYQHSGELKSANPEGGKIKSSFQAYALDLYGKYPIMCSPLSAVGTIGGAIYHGDYKGLPKDDFNKFGYRAGVGMQYDFTDNISARVIGRYTYIDSRYLNNLMEVNAGILYQF
ncbi:MAG: porin family protein [Alphaproteobacteria bacterium]|nr:porin family protein [Alphaproteobacteria bacterium]